MEYDHSFFAKLVRSIEVYMGTTREPGPLRIEKLNASALPLSAAGLRDDDVWNDQGFLKLVGTAGAFPVSDLAKLASPTFTGLVTTAGQIAFPATQNPSAGANVLDDYEEQTYTPTVTSTAGTFTSVTSISGYYTKVGNLVFASGQCTITTVGTATGFVIFTLPFTAARFAYGSGRQDVVGGFGLQVAISTGDLSHVQIEKYDHTSAIAATAIISWSVTYTV